MKNNLLQVVDFYGDKIWLVTFREEPYIPVKPIVENLGLDLTTQQKKLKDDVSRWQVQTIRVKAQDGKLREMLCIPLRKLPAWLMSISPSKVKPEIREKLVRYQEECDRVLWEYWSRMRGSPPARVVEEEEDPRELYRQADELARELQAIRKLEEEGLEEDEARLELVRRTLYGARAFAMLSRLGLDRREISALFLGKLIGLSGRDAARLAGVSREEAEAAYRAFVLLGRDPWEVVEAMERSGGLVPWEEEPDYGRMAGCVDRAIARLCARAGNFSGLRAEAPGWLVVGERWVHVRAVVFEEFGYRGGDVWMLAERMGWRRAFLKRRKERTAGLTVSEFEARYFGRESARKEIVSAPEPVARMAEWLVRYWEGADERHRAWLERQFARAFPDFAAENSNG